MNGYNTANFHGEFKGNTISRNGEPKIYMTGSDNPAFRSSETYTIPTHVQNEDLFANHLVYRPLGNNEQVNNSLNHVYGSSGNSRNHELNFVSTLHYPVNGLTLKSNHDNGHVMKTQTLGRNSAPLTIGRRQHIGAVSAGAYSRQHSDIRAFISHFDIETDRLSGYQYRPGEEITGTVILFIRKSLEIRFFELIATGHGRVKMKKAGDEFPQKVRETYLHKEKCIIGDRDAHARSVLTPGHYTSKFRVKLPADLPSTIHHEDDNNEFTFDVTYSLRVRICDDVGQSRLTTPTDNVVRVLLEKQINFNIQRGFDLNTIPDAMSPIIHTEQVYLSCNHQQAAIVSLRLNRAVFLAGDDMRLQMEISLPSSQSVKKITCRLQQLVTLTAKHEPKLLTLWKMVQKDPCHTGGNTNNHKVDKNVLELTIPTNTAMLSPYSLGNSKVKIEHFLTADFRFTPGGGKLSFKVPIGIGPCAEPIYAVKALSKKVLPLFNRTTRFPCFSTRTLTASSSFVSPTQRSAASVQVVTTYSNGFFARSLLCCMGSGDI